MLAKGRKVNTFYVIEAKIHKEGVNVVVKSSNIKMWHKRLDHIGEKNVRNSYQKRIFTQLRRYVPQDLCSCLDGNTHKVAFKSFYLYRKSQILDLIHIDVCMIQSRSIRGALYFVILIYACSSKTVDFCFEI